MTLTTEDRKVLESDYGKGEITREKAEQYTTVHRGSIRIARGLYRTEAEQRDFVRRGLSLTFPKPR